MDSLTLDFSTRGLRQDEFFEIKQIIPFAAFLLSIERRKERRDGTAEMDS